MNPTYYNGNKDIECHKSGGNYYLLDSRGIYDYGAGTIDGSPKQQHSTTWGLGTPQTAFWALEKANEYYSAAWGMDRPNHANVEAIYTDNVSSLSPIRTAYNPIDGVDQYDFEKDDPSLSNVSAAHLDVVCHEYTHALIYHGPNLDNYGEAGTIAEGFCDLIGTIAASAINPSVYSSDWTSGFGYNTGVIARKFADPANDYPIASIERYGSYNSSPSYKNQSSGIFRKYTSLVTNGGTYYGITVNGLGNSDHDHFEIMYWWMWNHANYLATRNQFLQYYEMFHGKCSPQWVSCIRAWAAVQVGTIPSCARTYIHTDYVVDVENHASQVTPHRHATQSDHGGIKIGQSDPDNPATIVARKWDISSDWVVSFNQDSSEMSIDSVFSLDSKMVTCIVTYSDTTQDTLTSFMHFREVESSRRNINNANQIVLSDKDVTVYPNPAKDQINIALSYQPKSPSEVFIIDMTGREVFRTVIRSQASAIHLPQLSPGIYTLRIKSDGKDYISKLSINN